MSENTIRIGGASGYWGDSARATPQLLGDGNLDFIVYDYLAEITMSILARARARNEALGYATDFLSLALKPNLQAIAAQGVRVIANAGGVNPEACADAVRAIVAEQGLALKVACVTGDDLLAQKESLASTAVREMFSADDFPDPASIQSINAYLGAFPVARALDLGADIVITGRCVDSAVTLGACIHSFGWGRDDLNKLAAGSLCGHILECGTQATGGNFTDWHLLDGQFETSGYPIAEMSANGSFVCAKPSGTSGVVSRGTVSEQMLYEIGDPQAYMLPDVVCDFSDVQIKNVAEDRVLVSGARGYAAPDTYKVSATYADAFRGGTVLTFYGLDADKKAQAFAEAGLRAAQNSFKTLGLADFSETSIEVIGADSQFGDYASATGAREVALKIAAKHPEMIGIGVFLKELAGMGLAGPPGLSGFAGARPKPSPVVRLYSFLHDKNKVNIDVECDGERTPCNDSAGRAFDVSQIQRPPEPEVPGDATREVPLVKLAWGRSGDKGDKANIGIIAREPAYLPFIAAALTEEEVARRFAHFLHSPDAAAVQRYYMPGSHALNFVLDQVLGGGGIASLRNDAQGKGYAQVLLGCPIKVSEDIYQKLSA